ncbi:helix-turn-helix domain-containing protein [Paratractidigestivibacter sp.]|uniref:helix-turn-helix domain-containing protein n=1 Tax=Paratractidigestivibacter sp. TaxID=2847316 RepID=UPI003A0FF378
MGQCEHLTIMEREDITALRAQGKGINDIARETGRSKVAVSREPPRNSYSCGGGSAYRASTAQRKHGGTGCPAGAGGRSTTPPSLGWLRGRSARGAGRRGR